jgi:quercetin dioxygenase-like cupin family protein
MNRRPNFAAVATAMAIASFVAPALAQAPATAEQPVIVMPDKITWKPMGTAGMAVSVVTGDPTKAAPYTMLIKIPAGMKIPPHSHPDLWRTSVVISGTIHFGFGNKWDDAALKPFTPGTIWTEPPGANHFVWAKDGEVIAMLTAMGPTGSIPVAQPK